MLLHGDYLNRDLHGLITTVLTKEKKRDSLSVSLINPRIDSIWVTVYGDVETLDVKESMKF